LDLVAADNQRSRGVVEYLLDGTWRLLSLYSAIYQAEGDGFRFYDLATGEFHFAQDANGAHTLPLTSFAGDYELFRFERTCKDRRLVNRAHALKSRISDSLIPVTVVVTDDCEMAARTCASVGNRALADAILGEIQMAGASR
jgi:hypothetical protein